MACSSKALTVTEPFFDNLKACWAREAFVQWQLVDAQQVSQWLTLADIDRWLAQPKFLAAQTVLLRGVNTENNQRATTRTAIIDGIERGLSVQVRHLEEFLPGTHAAVLLGQMLESRTGHPLESITLFVTAPGEQALPKHSDATEVFALQLSGRKCWEIGDQEFELGPGDLAYIPAGLLHSARSCGAGPSIGLTFVVKPITVADVLMTHVRNLLTDSRCQVTLPMFDLGSQPINNMNLPFELSRLFSSYASNSDLAIAAQKLSILGRSSPFITEAAWMRPSSVRRYVCRARDVFLEESSDQIRLYVTGGAYVEMPFFVRPEIDRMLQTTDPFGPGEIAVGLTVDECDLLLKKLSMIGAIAVVAS